MNKTAIVILSDLKAGTDEALGRVFNALAAAYDFQEAGEDVKIIFQGAGSRWPEQLQQEGHPAYALYGAVADKVEGISGGCANVFGANPSGLDLIHDNKVPGTPGLSSFTRLRNDGFQVLLF